MNKIFVNLKKQFLPVTLIIILTWARLIPHPPNFTPIVTVAILSGYFFSNIYLSFLTLLISMFIADAFIGFHEHMFSVYISLLLISFIFYKISEKINFKNLFMCGFIASLIFFIISNFGVWIIGGLYDRSLSGLVECYILAIPFFGNTFLSTVIFAYPAIFIYKSLSSQSVQK
tara:strand:+ start:284 stop:802 length:519 start_codon:yes stop_codon:yes gene_type:complete